MGLVVHKDITGALNVIALATGEFAPIQRSEEPVRALKMRENLRALRTHRLFQPGTVRHGTVDPELWPAEPPVEEVLLQVAEECTC